MKLFVYDDSHSERQSREKSFYVFLLSDLAIAIIILAVFLWYMLGRDVVLTGEGIVSARSGFVYTMTDTFETANDGGDAGFFEFPGLFRAAEPAYEKSGDISYYKDSVSEITVSSYATNMGVVRVAEVYIAEISNLKTKMAFNCYGRGVRESPVNMAYTGGASFAITGDNYAERDSGAVMRNGILYSGEAYGDVCVLGWDGRVALYGKDEFELSKVMETGAYQIWSHGPILLKDGEVPSEYDADTAYASRRAALGYYEPGHYCFVISEGNVTFGEMSDIMKSLGCESAYGLCGGGSAKMILNGLVLTDEQEVDRGCSDIIMITK